VSSYAECLLSKEAYTISTSLSAKVLRDGAADSITPLLTVPLQAPEETTCFSCYLANGTNLALYNIAQECVNKKTGHRKDAPACPVTDTVFPFRHSLLHSCVSPRQRRGFFSSGWISPQKYCIMQMKNPYVSGNLNAFFGNMDSLSSV